MRTLAATLALLAAAPAYAGGWLVGGSIGPGVAVSRFGWEGPAAFGGGQLDLSDVDVYGTLSLDLRVGRAVAERFALGLEIEGTLFAAGDAVLGHTGYEAGASAAARAVGVWRGERGLAFAAGAGAAIATFGGGGDDIGARDNVAEFETVIGPALKASVGWRMAAAQLELEASAAYLFAEHLSYLPVMLTLRARIGGM